MEKIILGTVERHLKHNAMIKHSQQGFTKRKSLLTNLISFYDEVICLGDEGKVVDVSSLDFSKAFDTVSQRILNGATSGCWLVTGNHQCSSGLNPRASSVQYLYQQSGCRS